MVKRERQRRERQKQRKIDALNLYLKSSSDNKSRKCCFCLFLW
jgi:hypothetical protein